MNATQKGTIVAVLSLCGCTSISVNPSCPDEIRVGETGMVVANERNPGSIPHYFWEVIPTTAGLFTNPTQPESDFQALEESNATIRLTAGDGLYQVVAECSIRIRGVAEVAVSLSAQPEDPQAGEPVTLTCLSVGQTDAVVRDIEQVIDPPPPELLDLRQGDEGVVAFEPTRAGTYVFRCMGANSEGVASAPVILMLPIGPGSENGNTNTNGNSNGNANANDNSGGSSNMNDNDAASTDDAAIVSDNSEKR